MLGAREINILCPFERRRDQVRFAVDHGQHTADAGGALDLPIRQRNRGLACADSGYVVGVMRQQTNVAVNHARANTLNLAVKEQAVRSADF